MTLFQNRLGLSSNTTTCERKDAMLGLHIDWLYVWSIFSFKEYSMNLHTRRKRCFVVFYAIFFGLFTYAMVVHRKQIGYWIDHGAKQSLTVLAWMLYLTEPCTLILQALVYAYPKMPEAEATEDDDGSTVCASSVDENSSAAACETVATGRHDEANELFSLVDLRSMASRGGRSSRPLQRPMDWRPKHASDVESLLPIGGDLSQIGVVISCHKSADVIVRTCLACMKHVQAKQIFVMDNANFVEPPDDTREVLIEAGLGEVNYIFNPFGNKTLAMFSGSVAAKDYKYLLLLDDDVTVPPNMDFGIELFSDTVKAVCYPIRAVHPEDPEERNFFIEWQGLEYKMADYSKMIQTRWSTVLYPHGAVCLWERETLIKCFREHDTVFYADDVKMGLWFSLNNYEMRIHYKSMVDTDAPTNVFGPYPNFYNQRVRSWDMANHVYGGDHVKVFLTTRHKTILGTIIMKLYQFYAVYAILADLVRIPVTVIYAWVRWQWLLIITPTYLFMATIALLIWNFIGYRNTPEMRSPLWIMITFQLYKDFSALIRVAGTFRAYFVYIPNYIRKPTIPELEARHGETAAIHYNERSGDDLKVPVWIDKTNPHFGKYYLHYDPEVPWVVNEPSEEDLARLSIAKPILWTVPADPAEAPVEQSIFDQEAVPVPSKPGFSPLPYTPISTQPTFQKPLMHKNPSVAPMASDMVSVGGQSYAESVYSPYLQPYTVISMKSARSSIRSSLKSQMSITLRRKSTNTMVDAPPSPYSPGRARKKVAKLGILPEETFDDVPPSPYSPGTGKKKKKKLLSSVSSLLQRKRVGELPQDGLFKTELHAIEAPPSPYSPGRGRKATLSLNRRRKTGQTQAVPLSSDGIFKVVAPLSPYSPRKGHRKVPIGFQTSSDESPFSSRVDAPPSPYSPRKGRRKVPIGFQTAYDESPFSPRKLLRMQMAQKTPASQGHERLEHFPLASPLEPETGEPALRTIVLQ